MAENHCRETPTFWSSCETERRCTTCLQWKPLDQMVWRKNPSGDMAPRSRCKQCDTKMSRKWRDKNPKAAALTDQRGHLRRNFGLTLEEYQAMCDEHGGRCAICKTDRPGGQWNVLQVDHCHQTGAIRGLLCKLCNQMLGHAKDSQDILHEAIAYLEKYRRLAEAGQCKMKGRVLVTRKRKLCKCGKKAIAKGLCGKHYQRTKYKRISQRRSPSNKSA